MTVLTENTIHGALRIGNQTHYPVLRPGMFATVNKLAGMYLLANGAVYWATGGRADEFCRDLPLVECDKVCILTWDDRDHVLLELQDTANGPDLGYNDLRVGTHEPNQPWLNLETLPERTALFIERSRFIAHAPDDLRQLARDRNCVIVLVSSNYDDDDNCDVEFHWSTDCTSRDRSMVAGRLVRQQEIVGVL